MAEGIFKFHCPFCRGRIGAHDEHMGLDIECPHCENTIIVPERGAEFGLTPSVDEEPPPAFASHSEAEQPQNTDKYDVESTQFLSADELHEAMEETAPDVDEALNRPEYLTQDELMQIVGVGNNALWNKLAHIYLDASWELAVTGELLLAYLEPLRKCVFHRYDQHFCKYRKREEPEYTRLVLEMLDSYELIISSMQYILSSEGYDVLHSGDAVAIGGFCSKLGAQFNQVQQYHEYVVSLELPQESPWTDMHIIASGWAPATWQRYNNWALHLKEEADSARHRTKDIYPQIGIVPVTLRAFMNHRAQLD